MNDMPLMGFGTFIGIELNRISKHQARMIATRDAVVSALRTGYRHLDLAENYGNLQAIKEALQIAFKSIDAGGLGLLRKDIWLTMKANAPFNDAHIDELLDVVGVEYVDLFLIHHPSTGDIFQSEASLLENWRQLANIDKVKIQRIGVSNFYEGHLSRLLAVCEKASLPKPYANEVEVNFLSKNASLVQYCQSNAVKVIAYSPLAYGYADVIATNETLKALAEKFDTTAAAVSLAWMMAKNIAVIPKSIDAQRQYENYQAQQLVKTLIETPKHYQALDTEADMFNDGVTTNAEDMKKHATTIKWSVESHPAASAASAAAAVNK